MPDSWVVRPLTADETRTYLNPMEIMIYDNKTQTVSRVLPEDFAPEKQVLSLAFTVDRESSGSSALMFGAGHHMMWYAHWGWYHDMFNSIKASAKSTVLGRCGSLWDRVLKFMKVQNMSAGPYRTFRTFCVNDKSDP